jgi:hypothetical protein
MATLQDQTNIILEHVAAFKGTIYDKCVYIEQYCPRTGKFMLYVDLLLLEGKDRSHRGAGDALQWDRFFLLVYKKYC